MQDLQQWRAGGVNAPVIAAKRYRNVPGRSHASLACCAVMATLAALLSGGCGGSPAPLTVHDKPVSHWLQVLKDPDARARRKAIDALGNVGPADPAVIPALIEALEDREAGVRRAAVLALLKIGPEASEAIPALRKAQEDKDAKVRSYATKALERIEAASEIN